MNKLSITIVAGAMSLTMGAANADSAFPASAQEWGPVNNAVVAGPHSRNLGSPFPASDEGKVIEHSPTSGSARMASTASSANDD